MEKYCVNCKFHGYKRLHNFFVNPNPNPICARLLKKDLVNGQFSYDNALDCKAEREDALRLEHFRCGVEGKYFELKEVLE